MAVDDDNSAPVAFPTTEDVTVVEPFAGSSSSFKIPVSCPIVTRCLTPNVINSLLQRSRASVGYLALFAIKGVDTNSREYLKSIRVLPEVTVVTPSSKHPRSSLTTAHNLLSDDDDGKSNSVPLVFSDLTLFILQPSALIKPRSQPFALKSKQLAGLVKHALPTSLASTLFVKIVLTTSSI